MPAPRRPLDLVTFYLVAGLTVLADQLSKLAVVAALTLGHSQSLVDGLFHLTYVRNKGAAFSLFWGHPFQLGLVAVAVALVVAVYHWRTRPRDLTMLLAMAFYLGGALGNAIDRLTLGYVRDMFDLRWAGENIFPIFNVADIAVNLAAGLFLLHALLQARRRPVPEASA